MKKNINIEWLGIFLLKEIPKCRRPSLLDILTHGLQLLLTAHIYAKYQMDPPLHNLVLISISFLLLKSFSPQMGKEWRTE